MRLVRPDAGPPLPRGVGVGRPVMPEWRKEWIANQPHFVLLQCGHKDDISLAGVLIRKAFGTKDVEVLCEPCDAFQLVKRKLNLSEYHGIPAAVIPDEPLF